MPLFLNASTLPELEWPIMGFEHGILQESSAFYLLSYCNSRSILQFPALHDFLQAQDG